MGRYELLAGMVIGAVGVKAAEYIVSKVSMPSYLRDWVEEHVRVVNVSKNIDISECFKVLKFSKGVNEYGQEIETVFLGYEDRPMEPNPDYLDLIIGLDYNKTTDELFIYFSGKGADEKVVYIDGAEVYRYKPYFKVIPHPFG